MSDRLFGTDLSTAGFLRDYWQRQPLLMRAVQLQLPLALTREALFAHAGDERLGARLISGRLQQPDGWRISYGPFAADTLAALPSTHPQPPWTLLVQDLDKVREDCAALLRQFDFLPRWRLDDVMASYAEPGGSVGPHIDQYDVFLIQLQGRRRWQWAPSAAQQYVDGLELKVLRQFAAEQDQLLEPGDMLYLPPGVAHFGVAESDCISLSVGLRTPASTELLSGLAEYWNAAGQPAHYTDPDFSRHEHNQLGPAVSARIRQQLQHFISADDDTLLDSFGRFITQYRLHDDMLDWPEPPQPLNDLPAASMLSVQPAARLAWRSQTGSEHQAVLFCNGERMECSAAAARLICDQTSFQLSALSVSSAEYLPLLEWLLAQGAIHIQACVPTDA